MTIKSWKQKLINIALSYYWNSSSRYDEQVLDATINDIENMLPSDIDSNESYKDIVGELMHENMLRLKHL